MTNWTLVGSFQNQIEALIAKGQLEAAGIDCRVNLNAMGDTLLGSFGVQNGPTEISVQEKDLQKAKEVLGGK